MSAPHLTQKRQVSLKINGMGFALIAAGAISRYFYLVKTTIDLPEELLHRAETIAAQRNITFQEMVIHGLTAAIGSPAEAADDDTEAFVAAFARGSNVDRPVGKVQRHEIYDRPVLHRL